MKILEQNGIDITNIDGAVFNNFSAGGRDGILKGVLNECNIYLAASNVLVISTGEILVQGIRIKLQNEQTFSMTASPSQSIRYHIIIRINRNGENILVDIFSRTLQDLQKDFLYKNEAGGVYEVEIARFTHETSGEISDVVRTLDIISGGTGAGGNGTITIGNVTTENLSPGLDAEVDIENRFDEDLGKTVTDFHFAIPKGKDGDVTQEQLNSAIARITPSSIEAVPITRKINDKTLGADITLTASDVGALVTNDLLAKIYPVGSIYMSTILTSPASFLGGTWERIQDKFLLSAGSTYTAGSEGGSADAVVVSHNHAISGHAYVANDDTGNTNLGMSLYKTYVSGANATVTSTVGESGVGKNMPPYLTVYMWRRVS